MAQWLRVWLSDIGMWLSVLGALAHCFVIGKDCMSCVTTLNRLKLILCGHKFNTLPIDISKYPKVVKRER